MGVDDDGSTVIAGMLAATLCDASYCAATHCTLRCAGVSCAAADNGGSTVIDSALQHAATRCM